MKNLYTFFLLSCFFMFSCMSNDAESNSKTANEGDTIVQKTVVEIQDSVSALLEKKWAKSDFEIFWQEFVHNVNNNTYLKSKILFPYSEGFEPITEENFDIENLNVSLIQYEKGVEIKKFESKDYMNGKIDLLLKEQNVELKDVYSVYNEDDPIGFFAYFKFINDDFRLIGFEEIQDASN